MYNKKLAVSGIGGQAQSYIYEVLHDINKLKILLVFTNKGFTWYRELKSFGINKKLIEDTLYDLNNLGLIDLKELEELDDIQYETLKGTKQDIQHYYKIYFTNKKLHEELEEFQEDIDYLINRNNQLQDFQIRIREKLKPFIIKEQQILQEERTQFTRKVNYNGIEFEKETQFAKEAKEFLRLTSTSKGRDLIIKQVKPLALMTETEKKRHTNKVFHNGKEVNSNIFKEIEAKDKEANEDFKTGTIGKSETQLEIEREKQDKAVFDMLGIDDE